MDATEANRRIGQTLRRARLCRGLSQATVAKRLHTTQRYISNVESGIRKMRLSEAILYAYGLDMTPHELYRELKVDLGVLEHQPNQTKSPAAKPPAAPQDL